MNKRKKMMIGSIVVVLCLFMGWYFFFLAPFNGMGVWKANSLGVLNQKSFTEIEELKQYFKDDKISKVKYLGRDSYEVFTDKGEFIIIADYSDTTFWKYKIFKLDKKARYFTNPM